jgi:hypothetical protein
VLDHRPNASARCRDRSSAKSPARSTRRAARSSCSARIQSPDANRTAPRCVRHVVQKVCRDARTPSAPPADATPAGNASIHLTTPTSQGVEPATVVAEPQLGTTSKLNIIPAWLCSAMWQCAIQTEADRFWAIATPGLDIAPDRAPARCTSGDRRSSSRRRDVGRPPIRRHVEPEPSVFVWPSAQSSAPSATASQPSIEGRRCGPSNSFTSVTVPSAL